MSAQDLPVAAWSGGAGFAAKVHAGARRDRIAGVLGGALKIEVAAAPERGHANEAVLKLLADALDLKRSRLRILVGETSPRKRIGVVGLDCTALRARIACALETGGPLAPRSRRTGSRLAKEDA